MVAWSYSVLDAFETCPYRYYLTKVTKTVVEPQSAEMKHGNYVHKAFELRVKENRQIPADLPAHYEDIAQRLIAASAGGQIVAEQKMALTQQYRPTSFFAKDVWVRAITDVTVIKGNSALVADYKTGNPKPNSAQLRLTAAVTFAVHPQVEKIANTFIWLKTGEVSPPEVFRRDQVGELWQEFLPRVQRLEHAIAQNKWLKNPSGLCRRHCPCITCEHNGRRG